MNATNDRKAKSKRLGDAMEQLSVAFEKSGLTTEDLLKELEDVKKERARRTRLKSTEKSGKQ